MCYVLDASALEGPVWAGVDVHKKTYAVAIRDSRGTVKSFCMEADDERLLAKLQRLPNQIAKVVYEAGPCGCHLYRTLRAAAGLPALAAAPGRIPRPVTRSVKTDSLDCRKLAEYAARDMLVPVFVPEEQEAGVRTLQRRRHALTEFADRMRLAA